MEMGDIQMIEITDRAAAELKSLLDTEGISTSDTDLYYWIKRRCSLWISTC